MIIQNTISSKYGDKHFIAKRDGKKFETKESKAAKADFHEYCYDIIRETTKDNFAEQLEFLDEVYNECINQIPNNY